MSWTTVIWSMSAAVCLTLAVMQFLVWFRSRNALEHLLFAIAAGAAAAIGMLEPRMMHARTPVEFGEVLRWMHVPLATLVVAFVWFIRLYLGAGRAWMAWSITGLRVLTLVPNFLSYPNATFQEITGLRQVLFLGEQLSVPVGDASLWRMLIHVSMFLFLVFLLDATIVGYRKGLRRRSIVVGGTALLAVVLAHINANLVVAGILPVAFISPAFLLIVLAMAFELSMDLSRAKELFRQLHESEKRMALAVKAANMGLWEWDVVRDEIWLTEVGRELVGLGASDKMSFEAFLQSLHPEDCEPSRFALRRLLDHGEDIQMEFRVAAPDGTTRWIATSGHVERDGNRKASRLRGVSMDITERRHAEAQLQNLRRDLAHISRVSALGQFSSAIAHELRQPLAAILRNAEATERFLYQTPPDLAELRSILGDIREDGQRAASVLERIRSLSQRRELESETLALPEILGQVTKLLQTEVQARYATLRVELAHELPQISGDRIQLQQVILNLLLNALDAVSEQPHDRRQVVVRSSGKGTGLVEVAISDSGVGIAPTQMPRLFEPFYTTKSSGTGMGLAISRSIVELHGGQLAAENNPEGGATFRFTLKAAKPGEGT